MTLSVTHQFLGYNCQTLNVHTNKNNILINSWKRILNDYINAQKVLLKAARSLMLHITKKDYSLMKRNLDGVCINFLKASIFIGVIIVHHLAFDDTLS